MLYRKISTGIRRHVTRCERGRPATRSVGNEFERIMKQPLTYKDAGVNIDTFNSAKDRIRNLARSTYTSGVLSDIGAFGGMFACDFAGVAQPVLVSSTD